MKKKTVLIGLSALCMALLAGCGKTEEKNKITIWTSGEDYKNEYYFFNRR